MKRFGSLFVVAVLAASPAFAQLTETGLQYHGGGTIDMTTGKVTKGVSPRLVGDAYNNMTFYGPGTANTGISSTTPTSTVWGDQVSTLGTGTLDVFSFSTFNSGSGAGNIDQYIVTVSFYAPTAPNELPSAGNFLFSFDTPLIDETDGIGGPGLAPGFFDVWQITGISSLNLNVSATNLIVTQTITQDNYNGTSSRFGIVSGVPGLPGTSSPTSAYVAGAANVGAGVAAYYNFGNPVIQADVEYQIGLIPEPATMALLGLGLAALARRRR